MVSETAVRQSIYERLNVASVTTLLADGSAGLVNEHAPEGTRYPICVFWKPSGVSVNVFGGEAFRDQLWGVKGVCRGASATPAEAIDKAVYDLLNFGSLTITGGTLLSMIRESDISYPETDGDQTYKHRGGIYRLRVA